MSEEVLDLDGGIEGQVRMAGVHRGHDPAGMMGCVEEVGVGEADMAGPGGHQLVDVGQDGILGHRADPPVVDDGDRAVPTAVRAASAGGHRADGSLLAGDGQAGVAAQVGEQPTVRHPGTNTAQLDGRSRVAAPGPGRYPGLELSGDDGVGRRRHRQVPGHPGIQTEEAQGQAGPAGPHGVGHPQGQAHSRVHGHRQGHPVGPVDIIGRQGVHGDVDTAHLVAGGEQAGGSGRRRQGLVTQLVGGYHQNVHRPSLRPAPTVSARRPAPPAQEPGPTTTSRAASARRRASSTSAAVGPRANRNPRYRSPSGRGTTVRPGGMVISRPTTPSTARASA